MRALLLFFVPVSLALSTSGSCGHAETPGDPIAAVPAAAAEDAGIAADTATGDDGSDAGELGDAGNVGDAGEAGVVDAGSPLPSFADEPFPEKGTPFPKAAAWASAPPVAIDRAHPASLFAAHAADKAQCTAQRLHEWVRIHCARLNGGAVLLGGNRDGLSIFFDKAGGGTAVIFPVRRGDRRVVEMLGSETISFKAFSSERATFAFVLSEQWPAGDERPTIVAE